MWALRQLQPEGRVVNLTPASLSERGSGGFPIFGARHDQARPMPHFAKA